MSDGCGYIGLVFGVWAVLLAIGTAMLNAHSLHVAWAGEATIAAAFVFVTVTLWLHIRRLER